MKYCKKTTQTHPIYISHPSCRCAIGQIIIDEGGCNKTKIFGNDEVINIDAVEKCLAKRERREQRSTMDITFGISDCARDCQMVLIDFKYRHKSFDGISSTALIGKIQGSIEILGNMPKISLPYYFVVKSKFVHQAQNRVARLFPNSLKQRQSYQFIDNAQLALFWIN